MHNHSLKIDPATLGFDFDGVIADTADTFIRLACEKYNYCDLKVDDIVSFEVEECLDMTSEMVQSIFLEVLLDSIGTGLQPMSGAVEVLGELTEQTEVTVITARPEAPPVHDWLETMLPKSAYANIRVIAMGDHDDKARHIREQGLTHFIDDRADTCNYLDSVGINSIVFNHPWNQNRHNLPMVNSWQDIRALCMIDTQDR